MNCLNACENDVFNFALSQGDGAFALYTCAEDLAEKYKVGEVADAAAVLQHVGLLCECGTSSNLIKISPAVMGDVVKGYFSDGAHASAELMALEKRLLEVEKAHVKAVERADALALTQGQGKGGLAKKDKE